MIGELRLKVDGMQKELHTQNKRLEEGARFAEHFHNDLRAAVQVLQCSWSSSLPCRLHRDTRHNDLDGRSEVLHEFLYLQPNTWLAKPVRSRQPVVTGRVHNPLGVGVSARKKAWRYRASFGAFGQEENMASIRPCCVVITGPSETVRRKRLV